jgi:hypothetical protein
MIPYAEKPSRMEVFRYLPGPLYFLRFHYSDRVENDDLLMTAAGEYTTDLAGALLTCRRTLPAGGPGRAPPGG